MAFQGGGGNPPPFRPPPGAAWPFLPPQPPPTDCGRCCSHFDGADEALAVASAGAREILPAFPPLVIGVPGVTAPGGPSSRCRKTEKALAKREARCAPFRREQGGETGPLSVTQRGRNRSPSCRGSGLAVAAAPAAGYPPSTPKPLT